MIASLAEAFRAVRRVPSLVLVVWLTNVAAASLLAVPLALLLEAEFTEREAGTTMMLGTDYAWWSRFTDTQSGWPGSFGPEILGLGTLFRSLDLLVRGLLPLGLLRPPGIPVPPEARVDPVVLALGAAYLLLQVFLSGGLLAVLRTPEGGSSVRALLHGSGFYFGRLARVSVLALLAQGLWFRVHGAFIPWAEDAAREAVAETTALAWLYGRDAVLLLGVLAIAAVSSYAKAIVVVEDRRSASLAVLSALSFCLSQLPRVAGQYLVATAVVLGAWLLWHHVDQALATTGFVSQALALLLMQGLVLLRVAARVWLTAAQVALYRRRG